MEQDTPSWQAPYLQSILEYGYTEREARFLITVGLFSGHFFRSHFLRFCKLPHGSHDTALIKRALKKSHIVEYGYRYKKRELARFHLRYKGFYRRLGCPESQLRRTEKSQAFLNIRLAILDYVLEDLTRSYLVDEASRVEYFTKTLGCPLSVLPAQTSPAVTRRGGQLLYFPDRFPISRDPLTFTYFEEFATSPLSFRTYLRSHAPLFSVLTVPFRLFYVSTSTARPSVAEGEWIDFVRDLNIRLDRNPKPAILRPDAERYFSLQERYERKAWSELSARDVRDRLRLDKLYGAQYRDEFLAWKNGKLHASEQEVEAKLLFYFPESLQHAIDEPAT